MMTIDDMLSEVAKIVEPAPQKKPAKTIPKPKAEIIHNKSNISETVPEKAFSGGMINTRPVLGLKIAKEIVYCIERAAELMGINAVISVVNEGGNLVAFEAMDNSFIASIRASQDKAFTAAALKMPTHKALEESRGGAFDGYTNGNGILMLGGGYPIELNGYVLGGIGVSGGTKDQDILLAKTGKEYFEKRTESLKV
jgi:uncharacterized protein GlcG (DUF336 family)